MAGWFVDIFVEYMFRVLLRSMRLVRSRNWPVVNATVLSAECLQAVLGCTVATVYYEYVVNAEKYGDTFEKPFISHESGKAYTDQFVKGMDFKVRVRPKDATASVPLRGYASLV